MFHAADSERYSFLLSGADCWRHWDWRLRIRRTGHSVRIGRQAASGVGGRRNAAWAAGDEWQNGGPGLRIWEPGGDDGCPFAASLEHPGEQALAQLGGDIPIRDAAGEIDLLVWVAMQIVEHVLHVFLHRWDGLPSGDSRCGGEIRGVHAL